VALAHDMGQIIEPDLASAFAVQDRLADDVLQLAHVLRPIVQAQGKEGGCFEMRGSGTPLRVWRGAYPFTDIKPGHNGVDYPW
jgi:hypothetical protein